MLITRESSQYDDGTNPGKYDFPGGRIEPGEHFKDGLRREVREECGLEIEIGRPIYVGEWRPIIHGEEVQIVAIFFDCHAKNGQVVLSPDHDDFQWIRPEEYLQYPLLSPNDTVFKEYIERVGL